MSAGATAQMAYGCRADGCELGFLTAARRDAHEISAHGGSDITARDTGAEVTPRVETVLGPVTVSERIEAFVGPTEEAGTMFACECGRSFEKQGSLEMHQRRARHGRFAGVETAKKVIARKGQVAGRGAEPKEPPPRRAGSVRRPSDTIKLPRAIVEEVVRELQGYASETMPNPAANPRSLREAAKRLELIAALREEGGW